MINTLSKKARVLEALQSNRNGLTAAQIEARYSVGNARATVSALREGGFNINTQQRTDSKGRTKTFYCMAG
jgi:chromosome segregation and condensation protein ScpB